LLPFDFVITFLAFIYALALAHLLLAAAHMIRHRRELIFDWAHGLWMTAALALLWANWISLWDFHALDPITLPTIAIGFLCGINQYLVCAFVSPKLDGEDGMDMRRFHETQKQTYVGSFAVLIGISIPINFLAGSGLSITNWSSENNVVVAMLPGHGSRNALASRQRSALRPAPTSRARSKASRVPCGTF
jgi:hypothetical protein